MYDEALKLLAAVGVTVANNDPLLDFICQSVTERILNETNQTEVPEGLQYVAAEMCVGQYLKFQKESGQLTGFDLDQAVKSIQEGDTNVSFAIGEGVSTPEQRLDSLIAYLMNGRKAEFIRYRRVVW